MAFSFLVFRQGITNQMYVKLFVPERLKDLRMKRKMKLEELAEASGLAKSAFRSDETDDYKDISLFSIVTLAEYYDITIDYLLGVSEIKNTKTQTWRVCI